MWRDAGYPDVTRTTARLLQYWNEPEREKKLFFCQVEAVETAIYITEAARKRGDAWIENEIREANDLSNPGLFRLALKMATGSGKTVVMGMLIAWHALNKLADSKDPRFSDTFLIVTPGITIRDRLRVLLPNDPDNYYRQHDLLPSEMMEQLGRAKILIVNRHTFKLRERGDAARLTKAILANGQPGAFTETPAQMVDRVCRELGPRRTSWSSTTRPTTATAASPTGLTRSSRETIGSRPSSATRKPGCGSRASKPSRRSSASGSSTTSPPPPSSSKGSELPREGRCFRGSSPTSRSSTPSSRAS